MSRGNVVISNSEHNGVGREALRFWWLPLLTLAAALGAAWYFTSRQPVVYRSSTSIIVGPSQKITNAREITEVYNTLDRRSIMATLAKTPTTGAVKERVAAETGAAEGYEITAVVVPDTNIIEISVDSQDAEATRVIADAAARQTAAYTAGFYDTFELKILDPARDARVIRPIPARNYAVGAALGLLSGIALAFLASFLTALRRRRTIYTGQTAELPRQTPVPSERYVGL